MSLTTLQNSHWLRNCWTQDWTTRESGSSLRLKSFGNINDTKNFLVHVPSAINFRIRAQDHRCNTKYDNVDKVLSLVNQLHKVRKPSRQVFPFRYTLQSTLALRYTLTPRYYGHPAITDTPPLRTPRHYGHPAITDTPLLRTPRYYGHPTITDTALLRSGAKSPTETTKKCMEITPAISHSR